MKKRKVLIASPIRQTPIILKEFLSSLCELEQENLIVHYLFVDDNLDGTSTKLLKGFAEKNKRTTIMERLKDSNEHYDRDEHTHYWKEHQVWKVASIKDEIIDYARKKKFDSLFLVDSDLVLHPRTLQQLVKAEKDIVSCIYWTRWEPDTIEMPQVWFQDEYIQYRAKRREVLTELERTRLTRSFFAELRFPGLYEVGGLGACTLISRRAILSKVSFAEIKNISFWGEDRHFCVRALAKGFKLFVETTYPAYHIYRTTDLAGVAAFKQQCRDPNYTTLDAKSIDSMNWNELFLQGTIMSDRCYEEAAAEYFERFLASGQGNDEQKLIAVCRSTSWHSLIGNRQYEKKLLMDSLQTIRRAEIFCRLGDISLHYENWREAIIWYRQALSCPRPTEIASSPDPNTWTWVPHIQLCVCYDRLGEFKNAMEHNEIGLSFKPDHAGMLYNKDYLKGRLVSQK